MGKLLYAESLAYSQMRPTGVESNHFAYHLDQLVKDDIVGKQDKRYFLAPQGLATVDRMSQEKMVPRQQPHILTVVDITNAKGQTLVFRRAFQPYIQKFGFPLGKTHLEESVAEAAERELREKTGLSGIALTQRGMVYVHVKQQDITITKALCHVLSGQVVSARPLCPSPHRGQSRWADVSKLRPGQCMPGFLDIKQLLATSPPGQLFFAELSYDLE